MPAAPRHAAKTEMEVEKILQWAYREELSKRTTSSAEGIWDRIQDQRLGIVIDPGHGAAQRYPHFGLPHPDAERIERAVSLLEDLQIDWVREAGAIMGDLIALVDPKATKVLHPPPPPRTATARWQGRQATVRPSRQVVPARALRTAALITMHAGMGTRPKWQEELPYPSAICQGSKITIIGECRGKNLYASGSYCPLEWSPSPLSIIETRADFLAWWRGMKHLAETLQLENHIVLPPSAAEMPWRDDTEPPITIRQTIWRPKLDMLMLHPQRKQAGPPLRRSRGEVRKVAVAESLD